MDKARDFQEILYRHFDQLRRDLPWRHAKPNGSFDAYKILVSEIMLQQTQVGRVTTKYQEFLAAFPSVEALARAPLSAVLSHWSGLGYNRRAKYLHEAAQTLQSKNPWTLQDLVACKGIGHNTAAAVVAYAYNQPQSFVETNIRSVYIHHFFSDQTDIADKEILELVEETMDREQPREFFWALMDYGSYLKSTVGNTARHSKHYAKQSKFQGSQRQIRGQILKALVSQPHSLAELQQAIPDERLPAVLEALVSEGLINRRRSQFYLP